jgi:hypothetical protein
MPIGFRAIKPNRAKPKRILGTRGRLLGVLQDFVVEAQAYLQNYPPTGPSSYVRTGTLGRSWHNEIKDTSGELSGTVSSQGQIAPYNIWVQGEQQSGIMRSRGWKTPKDAAKHLEPKFRGKVKVEILK